MEVGKKGGKAVEGARGERGFEEKKDGPVATKKRMQNDGREETGEGKQKRKTKLIWEKQSKSTPQVSEKGERG